MPWRSVWMAQAAHRISGTVLVVEHEAIVRLELAERLRDMGFRVCSAQNADEAIAILDRDPAVSLLLTDIRMSGSMDGIRLAHHVHERRPPVQIIVTSGLINTQPDQLPIGSIFLPKPCHPDVLSEAMASLLGGLPVPRISSNAGLRG